MVLNLKEYGSFKIQLPQFIRLFSSEELPVLIVSLVAI